LFRLLDLQADISAELIRARNRDDFNQRSIAEILQMILTVGRIVGVTKKARAWWALLQTELDAITRPPRASLTSPRVLFEDVRPAYLRNLLG